MSVVVTLEATGIGGPITFAGLRRSVNRALRAGYGGLPRVEDVIGIAEAKKGMWVRTKDGSLGEIIGVGTHIGTFLVQMDPLGKRRHRHRRVFSQDELFKLTEMEVLAEVSR